jgi:hypothetical protein
MKGAKTLMYDIIIRVQVDAAVVPYKLENIELAELVVEDAVGCTLEKLFAIVDMKEVTISPSSQKVEVDWDALLSQDF